MQGLELKMLCMINAPDTSSGVRLISTQPGAWLLLPAKEPVAALRRMRIAFRGAKMKMRFTPQSMQTMVSLPVPRRLGAREMSSRTTSGHRQPIGLATIAIRHLRTKEVMEALLTTEGQEQIARPRPKTKRDSRRRSQDMQTGLLFESALQRLPPDGACAKSSREMTRKHQRKILTISRSGFRKRSPSLAMKAGRSARKSRREKDQPRSMRVRARARPAFESRFCVGHAIEERPVRRRHVDRGSDCQSPAVAPAGACRCAGSHLIYRRYSPYPFERVPDFHERTHCCPLEALRFR
jgi:hypothetical protein